MTESSCDICRGIGKNQFNEICPYCNGTGEWNQASFAYVKNHICQCIFWDRKFCPICKKKCHHSSSQTPKQVIDSGYGGLGATTVTTSVDTTPQEEEIVV